MISAGMALSKDAVPTRQLPTAHMHDGVVHGAARGPAVNEARQQVL